MADLPSLLYGCGIPFQLTLTVTVTPGPGSSSLITYTVTNPGIGTVDGPLFVYDAAVGLVALNAYNITPGATYSYSVSSPGGTVSKAAVIFAVPGYKEDRCIGRSNIVEYSLISGSAYLTITPGIGVVTIANLPPLGTIAATNVVVTFTPPPGTSALIINNLPYPLVNGSVAFPGGTIIPGGTLALTYQVRGASGLMIITVSTPTYNANAVTSITVTV